jgi:hypothetical protein
MRANVQLHGLSKEQCPSKGFVAVTSIRSVIDELHSLLSMLPVNRRGTGMIHENILGNGGNQA